MSDMWIWITIAGLTAATLITRAGFLVLGERLRLPPRVERALRYAPACALAAIVVPDVVFVSGTPLWSFENYRLIAAVAATIFFIRTRNMLWTIVFGMAVFTLLRVLSTTP
ncbi:MAG TPA: AzlD domain-containing protein [Burkholderiaceae bacterium]|nr:AzlD domain-containing protein [Burkholderiaceae bacterium]